MDKREFLIVGASIAGLTLFNAACTTTTGRSGIPRSSAGPSTLLQIPLVAPL